MIANWNIETVLMVSKIFQSFCSLGVLLVMILARVIGYLVAHTRFSTNYLFAMTIILMIGVWIITLFKR